MSDEHEHDDDCFGGRLGFATSISDLGETAVFARNHHTTMTWMELLEVGNLFLRAAASAAVHIDVPHEVYQAADEAAVAAAADTIIYHKPYEEEPEGLDADAAEVEKAILANLNGVTLITPVCEAERHVLCEHNPIGVHVDDDGDAWLIAGEPVTEVDWVMLISIGSLLQGVGISQAAARRIPLNVIKGVISEATPKPGDLPLLLDVKVAKD